MISALANASIIAGKPVMTISGIAVENVFFQLLNSNPFLQKQSSPSALIPSLQGNNQYEIRVQNYSKFSGRDGKSLKIL